MAKRKLTTFSKFLIVILIVGGVFAGVQYLKSNGVLDSIAGDLDNNTKTERPKTNNSNSGDDDVIDIAVVTWGGYAGGQYFNEGFDASEQSRYYKDYGIKVKFHVLDDPEASLAAWKNGEIDVHWYTIDAFPTILEGLQDFDPVALWQADWSRGGDAIVVRPGINNVSDLEGKKIAVAEMTPSHSFLLYLLGAGGLKGESVQIVPQVSAVEAAAAFKSKQVDAAVVWSPDDEDCLRSVTGSRILESTRSASNIIADFFFAKREYADKNRDKLQKLYEGWMIGAAEINNSEESKDKAIKILASGLGIAESDAKTAINNVRLVTHGDNLNFFGLNPSFQGTTGNALYSKMANDYKTLGYAQSAPNWRRIAYPFLVQQTALTSVENDAEKKKDFDKITEEEAKTKEAIATKQVSISFRTGESQLDDNTKYIIQKEFVEIAKAFGNARIRIEGNTDNVGSRTSNIALSKKRAQAVADYLINDHAMSPNRFNVIGNGPDKPVDSNSTESGRSKNRRTDFELVRE